LISVLVLLSEYHSTEFGIVTRGEGLVSSPIPTVGAGPSVPRYFGTPAYAVFIYYFNCISFAIRLSGRKVAIKLID